MIFIFESVKFNGLINISQDSSEINTYLKQTAENIQGFYVINAGLNFCQAKEPSQETT